MGKMLLCPQLTHFPVHDTSKFQSDFFFPPFEGKPEWFFINLSLNRTEI